MHIKHLPALKDLEHEVGFDDLSEVCSSLKWTRLMLYIYPSAGGLEQGVCDLKNYVALESIW